MKTLTKIVTAAAVAAVTLSTAALPAGAGAFRAWAVADVPAWDTLNVRAWPSSKSQILVAYPNGTLLSMTGKCTGGVHLDTVAALPAWQQRAAVREVWCEAWIDPQGNGNYRTAWVYGKYIAPA